MARLSEVLLLECTTLTRERAKHVALEDVRDHASLLEKRHTVLVHVTDAIAEALEKDPLPGITVAQDGMVLGF